MKPDGGEIDWNIALGGVFDDSITKRLLGEIASARSYNADGTWTRNGITYDADGNDVNTESYRLTKGLEKVLGKLTAEDLDRESDEYQQGWEDALAFIQQEIDLLNGTKTS